jgi:nucleoside-diphosphate-sugar epimerase
MHVFVTGATGHVGSALVPELLNAGHQVTALARSTASIERAERLGAAVQPGDIHELDVLEHAARQADGVIHLAFREDAMRSGDFAGAMASDLAAIRALGKALEGTAKPFVGAAVMLPLAGRGRTVTEEDTNTAGPRVEAENFVVALAHKGVRSSVVRLSPITHSPELDRHGFATALIRTARKTGVSAYIGNGENRWSAAHTRDTARLFRLALETATAGTRLHAVGDEGVPTKVIASAIGETLGLPCESIPVSKASDHFGFLGDLFQLDAPASSTITRRLTGWETTEASLLEDLHNRDYYRN